MLPISKIRLLCYLQSRTIHGHRDHENQGLTLIELLVVIVILGLLAAIASSAFLNATARAKESEAKVNVGAMLKAQQMAYVEQGSFARNLRELGLGIATQTQHYEYKTHLGGETNFDRNGNLVTTLSIAIAIPHTDVRGYMGKVWLDSGPGEATVNSVACEGDIRAVYFMNDQTYCN